MLSVVLLACRFGGQAPGTSEEERQWAFRKFGFEFDVFVSGWTQQHLPAAAGRPGCLEEFQGAASADATSVLSLKRRCTINT
jgi:hypothetical protein